ncbi:glucose-6-phosphate 1-epimerase [Pseudohyphozyma bogoriensis]|nr:glucose-6-phosphate 1-epimerase [Pseudohyphozyma bogoriensis]
MSNGKERIFTSTKSPIEGPAPLRGGIPLCWPIFGPADEKDETYGKLAPHGLARVNTWSYVADESGDSKDAVRAVFSLKPTPSITAIYKPDFHLLLTVALSPSSLTLTLKTTSPSSADFSSRLRFQAVYHTYFRLPSTVVPSQCTVTPVKGLKADDRVAGISAFTVEENEVKVDGPEGEINMLYYSAPDVMKVDYNGEGAANVVKQGMADAVLWCCGGPKGKTIPDLEEGGASRYVCLESGQIGDFVELKAGESWEGSVTLSFDD